MNLYEGLFLINNSEARKDYDAVNEHVAGIITKYGGDIKISERWAERKLAYTVKRRDRGTYILVYFNAPPDSIAQIKHDCVIDEVIMRIMILRVNALPEPKAKPEPEKEAGLEEKQASRVDAGATEAEEPQKSDAEDEAPGEPAADGHADSDDAGAEEESTGEVPPEVAESLVPGEEEPVEAVEGKPAVEPAGGQAGQTEEAL